MIDIKSSFSTFLFCTHIDEVQIFNEAESVIRLGDIAVGFEGILGARGQQGYAMDAAVPLSQADNSRSLWNSKHESQGPPGRIASRDFGLEEGDTVTAARPYYPAKASGWP